jgi:hypothetical protein
VCPSLPISALLVYWEQLVRLAATKHEPGKQNLGFLLIFVESFDERCYIPYIIYCMTIPTDRFYCAKHNSIRTYDADFIIGTNNQI